MFPLVWVDACLDLNVTENQVLREQWIGLTQMSSMRMICCQVHEIY